MAITLEQLTAFFGWCAVVNSIALTGFTIAMVLGRNFIPTIHAKIFDMSESAVRSEHFSFLATYKAIIMAINIVPYIVLKLMLV